MATYNDTHYNDTQIAAFRKEFNEFLNIAKEKSTAVAIDGTFRENTFFQTFKTSDLTHSKKRTIRSTSKKIVCFSHSPSTMIAKK